MTLANGFDQMAQEERQVFAVVHPLDDEPEVKVDIEHLGPMKLTKTVRACLLALRGYLLVMFGLLVFRVLQLAGLIR